MSKQPKKTALGKKDVQPFNLSAYKNDKGVAQSNTTKKLDWLVMPEAFQEATKLPGIPMGYYTGVRGWSDTGKSTLKYCLMEACVRQGVLPIVFETEGHFDFQHAADCGVPCEKTISTTEVVNAVTGEVSEQELESWDGPFIVYDNAKICDEVGLMDYSTHKEGKTQRRIAVMEDVALIINRYLDDQESGKLPMSICFIWDSVGSIPSWKSITSASGNAMFDAASMGAAFKTIFNQRITSSRSADYPYTNTFLTVNKIWNDSMNSMGGLPSIKLKGGEEQLYNMRLLIHVGGQVKGGTKKLKATSKGEEYRYGVVTKIEVVKNHLPSPFNITYKGEMACVHNGICSVDKLNEYKKEHVGHMLKRLEAMNEGVAFDENDITYTEEGNVE